ncbi:hypothetical protein VTJ83DRAFT_7461 [Remersonia thermophila]|uniref:SPX domain-containing protein n=1 Tax=Remersonia thermophila TaxID=72144 RepID=A0ABR4D537_9PEZI
MKFGDQFERESVPQWSLHNIDYNGLKHYIKVHTTKDQATTAIAIPGRGNTALSKFEDDFYGELCRQHDRVHLFVSSKADEIARRLQHLSGLVHRLMLRCATSPSSAPRMPLKRRQRFARYERMVLQCGQDIKLLRRFVSAQMLAFRKILKKYRKWTGSSAVGSRFRDNVLSDPKSFTKRDFSPLQSQHDDLLQTLRAALPANLSGDVAVANHHHHHRHDDDDDDDDGGGGYYPTARPRSGARSSRPGVVTYATPDPQPAAGYWNEYDHGSEAGDLERGADDYAIYIDPNADDGFPGVKTLHAIFVSPVRRLQRLLGGRHAPGSDTLSSTPDDERTSLLGTRSPLPTPYGTSHTPPNGFPSFNSPPPGSRGSHSPTALGTDTDLDFHDDDDDDDNDATRGYGSGSDDRLAYMAPGYPASYYSAGGAGYDSYYQGPHVERRAMALFRDRVLARATWACFGVALVLAGIAGVLVTTGKHKMRVEVDAGVIVGIITSLGLACAAVCMAGARPAERIGLVGGLAAAAMFAVVCVTDGVLLVLVMGNARL